MKKEYGKIFGTWIVLAVMLAGCGGGSAVDAADREESSQVQEVAEDQTETSQIDFSCQDMEGNTVSAAVFSESKLTMVNVWATYCNPCLSEMPGLGKLAGKYEPEDFQIIGVISDVQEGADAAAINNAAALIETTGADYTHLLLNESIYHALLTEVTAVPTTFFVDKNGTVLDTVIGAMEESAWEEKINGLLEEL